MSKKTKSTAAGTKPSALKQGYGQSSGRAGGGATSKTGRHSGASSHQYTQNGRQYFTVDMRRRGYTGQKWKHCADKKSALEYARGIAEKVAAVGINSINRLNIDPRIAKWEAQLAIHGKSVDEAIDLALRAYAQEARDKASPFLSELVTSGSLQSLGSRVPRSKAKRRPLRGIRGRETD